MRALIRGCVSFVLVGVGLTTVWAEPAAAATVTVGTTELGVGAFAGTDNQASYQKIANHDGNVSLTRSDSDTGPDGSASATATISSTASTSKVTIAGTASTSQDPEAYVSLYPAVVYLDTVLDQSGQWVFAGSFDTSASDTAYDACIRGSVRVAIYPPGEDDVPDYNELAAVNSCTGGAGHDEFGDLDGTGVTLAAGSRLEITGGFTSPSSFGSGTSSASFSLQVSTKVATSVPGKPTVTGSTPSAGAVSVAFSPPASDGGSPVTSYTAQCVSTNGGTTGTTTGATSPIQVTGLSAGKSYRCRVRATNAVGAGAFSAYGATVAVPAATAPGKPTVTGSTPSAGAVSVAFSPPASNGGSPVTSLPRPVRLHQRRDHRHQHRMQPVRSRSPASPRGKSYRCRVQATNAVGAGAFSAYGATVSLPAAVGPGKPTVTGSTPSAGAVRVAFTRRPATAAAPSPPTSPSASPPTAGPTPPRPEPPSPIQVTGLSAGKSYRCRVRATNAVGTGAFSPYGATVVVP